MGTASGRHRPMLAVLGGMPADPENWHFEFKWDGVRTLAFVRDGHLCLESRNGADVTTRYPELEGLPEAVPAKVAILDGEVVALDADGRPSFHELQHRMHVASPAKSRQLSRLNPVVYMIFDLLHLDGEDLCDLPYTERRARLEALGLEGRCWRVPPRYPAEGEALLEAARRTGLEGIMAKRPNSRYRPGERSSDWQKVKLVGRQELVLGGWLPGGGRLEGLLGALLVGYYEEGRLRFAGKVGTGFTEDDRERVCAALKPLERRECPFAERPPYKEARYVEPCLVAEVEFRGWTPGGHLRQPSYKGLRTDRDPLEVVREPYQVQGGL